MDFYNKNMIPANTMLNSNNEQAYIKESNEIIKNINNRTKKIDKIITNKAKENNQLCNNEIDNIHNFSSIFSFHGAIKFNEQEIEELSKNSITQECLTFQSNIFWKTKQIISKYWSERYSRWEIFYAHQEKGQSVVSFLNWIFHFFKFSINQHNRLIEYLSKHDKIPVSLRKYILWNIDQNIIMTNMCVNLLETTNQNNNSMQKITLKLVENYINSLNLRKQPLVKINEEEIFQYINQILCKSKEIRKCDIKIIPEANHPYYNVLYWYLNTQNLWEESIDLLWVSFGWSLTPYFIKATNNVGEHKKKIGDINFVDASIYWKWKNSIKITDEEIKWKDFLICDDWVFTGKTLTDIEQKLKKWWARNVKFSVIWISGERRLPQIKMQNRWTIKPEFIKKELYQTLVRELPYKRIKHEEEYYQWGFNLEKVRVRQILKYLEKSNETNKKQWNYIILSGLSGSWKSTILKELLDIFDLNYKKIYTTRPARESEINKKSIEYIFVSPKEFQNLKEKNKDRSEYQIHGNHYWSINSGNKKKDLKKGKNFIVNIFPDKDKFDQLKKKYKDFNTFIIFLDTPKYICTKRLKSNNRNLDRIEKEAILNLSNVIRISDFYIPYFTNKEDVMEYSKKVIISILN